MNRIDQDVLDEFMNSVTGPSRNDISIGVVCEAFGYGKDCEWSTIAFAGPIEIFYDTTSISNDFQFIIKTSDNIILFWCSLSEWTFGEVLETVFNEMMEELS